VTAGKLKNYEKEAIKGKKIGEDEKDFPRQGLWVRNIV